MILVKTDYTTAKIYEFNSVKTKVGSKKHQVYFKVYCDDTDVNDCIELYKSSNNIVMLEYQGMVESLVGVNLQGVYITKVFDFGTNITEEDIIGIVQSLPDGLTGIIRLPQEYKDMRFIYNMSKKYLNIRFCGGTTFCLDGCRLGCCGRDILDSRGIKYDADSYMHEGCSCALETVLDTDVELEIGKLTKRSSNTQRSGGTKKKKVALFKDLLYSGGTFDL